MLLLLLPPCMLLLLLPGVLWFVSEKRSTCTSKKGMPRTASSPSASALAGGAPCLCERRGVASATCRSSQLNAAPRAVDKVEKSTLGWLGLVERLEPSCSYSESSSSSTTSRQSSGISRSLLCGGPVGGGGRAMGANTRRASTAASAPALGRLCTFEAGSFF